ncbi:MAG: membrane dipeptidase [Candidatus Zixiibacteriota bacterium]
MTQAKRTYPVVDLHCDMTHYLATVDNASPDNTQQVGCATPFLKEGKVALQVMAISSVEETPDLSVSNAQIAWYGKLLADYSDSFTTFGDPQEIDRISQSGKTAIVPAIENASSFCGADDSLEDAFMFLDRLIADIGRPLYISLTHHRENRFGGGNTTDVGLKDDGRTLLQYLNGKKIAVDLSHTSDDLAHDIIDHIDSAGLRIPIIASHSNFRSVHDHRRNLPDELAKEIMSRQGLIGINFVRAFMHPSDPAYLMKHIEYGLSLGGEKAIALGADFFYTDDHPDQSRRPFYFPEHENAGKYVDILHDLTGRFGESTANNIANQNALRFMKRLG